MLPELAGFSDFESDFERVLFTLYFASLNRYFYHLYSVEIIKVKGINFYINPFYFYWHF